MIKKFEIISQWTRKLFRINSSSSSQRGSKFTVVKERTIAPLPKNVGSFKNITQGRPKKCPFCLTDKLENIERIKGEKQWKCKKCKYEW